MSSLQLQVGRHQSQRDRHRSCSQPRRSLVLTFECPPHMSDVLPMQMQVRCIYCHRRAAAVSRTHRRVGRRWLPCTRDLRTYCQCRCKPAAFTTTDAGARQPPAAHELTAAASGSTSEPARPTQRRVGCIHCHRRRPRMSSLQLQVGRRQSQRDRHRSCSQPRRPTQRHVRRLPLRRVVRRWLPCTRDLRTYCQCRCKPAPLHSLPPTQVRGSCRRT